MASRLPTELNTTTISFPTRRQRTQGQRRPVVVGIVGWLLLLALSTAILTLELGLYPLALSAGQWIAGTLRSIAGTAIYVGLLTGLFVIYLAAFHRAVLAQPLSVAGILLALVVALLATKVAVPERPWAAYAIPLATGAILVSNLVDSRLAIVLAAFQALLLAPVYGGNPEPVTLAFTTGVVGALAARRIERIHTFFVAGLQVMVAGLAVMVAYRLPVAGYDWVGAAPLVLALFANGALTALLTLGASALAGAVFGAATTLRLLELAHPTQPLLRRLLLEAPGTYHHSITVATLAERAAERVDGNPLLARVGAYYHDLGKLHRPYYFIENQLEDENIHDHLLPEASAQAIIEHVSQGLALARQHRLPRQVHAFIAEHHSTTLIEYFYRRARKQQNAEPVDEAPFRYPGPKPRTKETAIVMLADSVEAWVRSASTRSAQRIGEMVGQVIQTRMLDGQLDDCDLTLQDLREVRRSFTRQLQGIHHSRVEYPEVSPGEASIPVPAAAGAGND